MIQNLSHTTIYVHNQDEALAFYTDKLGFVVRMDVTIENGFRWLTVGPASQPDLDLVLFDITAGGTFDADSAAQLREIQAKGIFGGGVFSTPDCHATYAEFKARGVEFVSPPQEQPYGVEAVFKDPSGNIFSLTQRR